MNERRAYEYSTNFRRSIYHSFAHRRLPCFFVSKERKANRLTPLAGLALGFVVAGIAFGDNRFISYSLFAVGVILAVIDAFNRSKSQ